MQESVQRFLQYIQAERGATANTVLSYERDLRKMQNYMEAQGIHSPDRVSSTALNAYILQMESQGLAPATISRTVTAVKRFFDYLCKHEGRREDPAERLKAPRIAKKKVRRAAPSFLPELEGLRGEGEKLLRDKAMLLALCQGIRASELTGLHLSDINFEYGYIRLAGNKQSRTLAIGRELAEALKEYLEKGRPVLLHGRENESVFVNCSGGPLSRQSVWKIVKYYGQKLGAPELTPDGLRLALKAEG